MASGELPPVEPLLHKEQANYTNAIPNLAVDWEMAADARTFARGAISIKKIPAVKIVEERNNYRVFLGSKLFDYSSNQI